MTLPLTQIPVVEEIALSQQSEGDATSLWELSGGGQQQLTAELPVKVTLAVLKVRVKVKLRSCQIILSVLSGD